MILYSGSDAVQTTAICVKESFSDHTSTVEVMSPMPIYGEATLVIGEQKILLLPLQSIKINDISFNTLLVSKTYYKSLLKINEAITGSYTLEEVLGQLGWGYVLNKQTQVVYWEIPQLPLKRLATFLESKVSVVGGGGFVSTFNIAGAFYGIDLKTEMEKTPQFELVSDVVSHSYDQTWIGETPGVIKFTQDLLDENKQTTFTFQEGFQEASKYQLLANPLFVGLKEIIYRNDFYRGHYTTNRLLLRDTSPKLLTLGATVTFRAKQYVIYEVKIYQNFSADIILVSN